MAIQKLGVDRQCGLKGNVINVINPINETATILPRNFDDASVVQLMLMRKMEYKNPYMFETIRPKKVRNKTISISHPCQPHYINLSINLSSKNVRFNNQNFTNVTKNVFRLY